MSSPCPARVGIGRVQEISFNLFQDVREAQFMWCQMNHSVSRDARIANVRETCATSISRSGIASAINILKSSEACPVTQPFPVTVVVKDSSVTREGSSQSILIL